MSIVDVVGAIPMAQASGASVRSNFKSAACIKVLFLEEEITAVRIPNLRVWAKMSKSSDVSQNSR